MEWNVPFRVATFLYLTSPKIRYIVIGDINNPFYQLINHSLPEEMNIEFHHSTFDVQGIQDLNNYKTKLIFVDNSGATAFLAPTSLGYLNNQLTAIKIKGNAENGNITFFTSNGRYFLPKGSAPYLHIESLFAAMFSENIEMYTCMQQKAFKRLSLISQIYLKKRDAIQLLLPELSLCKILYSSSNIPYIVSNATFSLSTIQELSQLSIDEDENINKKLQLASCPMLY